MIRHTVADEAARLMKEYQSRNPFELAEAVGAQVRFADLGDLKGLYTCIQNSRFLVINNALDEMTARIVCAHELAHDQLHRGIVQNSFLRESAIYDLKNQTEYEANLFAAELLLSDEEILESAREGQDIASIAATTGTDVNLVALKLEILAKKGFVLNQYDHRSDFLRR